MNNIYKKLALVQQELKAPKNQYNNFGGYSYRSCEDIFEAVKPILEKNKCTIHIEDELQNIGERYYVKAVVRFIDLEKPFLEDEEVSCINQIISIAYAREEEHKKGMDGSQITGASSSYARKYALNGLFLIDDVKDSDTTNTGEEVVYITEKQKSYIEKLIGEEKIDEQEMLKYYEAESIDKLTIKQASEIIKMKGEK